MKLIVWTIQEIFKMLNQYAVDIPTLPVDQCHSHLIRYLEGCCDILSYRRAAKKGRQAFGTHMVYRETLLQIHMHLHQLLILKNWIHGVLICRNHFTHQRRRRMRIKHHFMIRDASPDRQPQIQSSHRVLQNLAFEFFLQMTKDFKSSTESTISTSLIQCIASVGNCEQVHTSVLNLIFQQANVAGAGNLSKWRSEICSRCWSAP